MSETLTKPGPELITGIPDAAELHRMFGSNSVRTHEPMRPGLYAGYTEGSEDDLKRAAIHNLRSEIAWGNPDDHDRLVSDGYAVARELGDAVIRSDDEDAFSLLNTTRTSARMNMHFRATPRDLGGGHLTSKHGGAGNRDFGVAVEDSFPGSNQRLLTERRLDSAGVQIDPSDLGVFIFLQNAGHESAHAIQLGIADSLRQTGKFADDNIHHASKPSALVLSSHPEEGSTGNLETDTVIRDEQFAEGYGLEVVGEAARILGYDQQTIDAVRWALGFDDSNLHHSHLLEQVTEERSLKQVFAEHGVKGSVGESGYTKPFNKTRLVKELKMLHDALLQSGPVEVDQRTYTEKRKMQSPHTVEVSPRRRMTHREKARAIGSHTMRLLGRRRR